jgi:hypothetical protein
MSGGAVDAMTTGVGAAAVDVVDGALPLLIVDVDESFGSTGLILFFAIRVGVFIVFVSMLRCEAK